MNSKRLSIVIPVFNEATTIADLVRRVAQVPLTKEILCVDDGSTDRTPEILRSLAAEFPQLTVFTLPRNRGKGAALREGLSRALGEVAIIQDADLELNPQDFLKIEAGFSDSRTQAVFGNRFHRGNRLPLSFAYLANRFLSLFASIVFLRRVKDIETCYKAVKTELFRSLDLESDRFDIETEISCKLIRRGVAIRWVDVEYHPRNRAQGKKIQARDGLVALLSILKWRFE